MASLDTAVPLDSRELAAGPVSLVIAACRVLVDSVDTLVSQAGPVLVVGLVSQAGAAHPDSVVTQVSVDSLDIAVTTASVVTRVTPVYLVTAASVGSRGFRVIVV